MKKIFIISVLFLLLCVSTSHASDVRVNSKHVTTDVPPVVQQRKGEAAALASWKRLKDYFVQSKTSADSIDYPDYYGGSFVEDGKLIVYIVKGERHKGPQFIYTDAAIIVKESRFSYNDLQKTYQAITEFMASCEHAGNPLVEKFSLCSLSETNNRVEVYFTELSPSLLSEFKKQVSNSPAIEFRIAPQPDDDNLVIPNPVFLED
ncbi:hypothetical protein, secreted [gut metagenome]|uniref:Uncharacterized protein n=1 Tax=gut metagenome TaxID=749906 RepID=J9GSQ4_9ZZZZ